MENILIYLGGYVFIWMLIQTLDELTISVMSKNGDVKKGELRHTAMLVGWTLIWIWVCIKLISKI